MKVDYIIVGLGLAGIAFAEELSKLHKTFVVFEDNSQTSSKVAGGVYNPVILKRFTLAWNGHEQLVNALPFYEQLENKLDKKFDYRFETRKVFQSVQDQNNWFVASDKPLQSNYMKPEINFDKVDGVIANYGFGELTGTGRVDTISLIKNYKQYLLSSEKLIEESFDYNKVAFAEDTVSYKDYEAKRIVFCEGFGLKQNPFFNYLPLNGTKGETLTIESKELDIDFLLKSSVFVLPLGNNRYKVGATFNWTDKTLTPTSSGKEELLEKLSKVLNTSFKVIEHSAGIRPTVKDRRPLIGVHPKYKQLAVLNGFGTRGVMIAPTAARQLLDLLENNIPLPEEVSINRF